MFTIGDHLRRFVQQSGTQYATGAHYALTRHLDIIIVIVFTGIV